MYSTRKSSVCSSLESIRMGRRPLLEKLKSINLKGQGLPHDRIGPTVGLNIGCIEDANVKLVFWDLGRQPGLRTIWEKYSHAIVYVIDSSSAQHLKMPNLLLDLPAAVREEELDRHLHLKEFDERPCMFVAGSAYDGTGIKLGIDWLVEEMGKGRRTKALRARTDTYAKI
uniref:ADP-ribosylation factor-related protein 1 n=1 Tax=Aegilops tauschii TaxID=37682 RepID=R7WFG3_AEGTA